MPPIARRYVSLGPGVLTAGNVRPRPADCLAKIRSHRSRRWMSTGGSDMDLERPFVSTAVLPPDLTLHPTFPAQPAFRPACVDEDVHFRHSGWLRDRRRVWDAINAVFPESTRSRRFADCGSSAWVVRNENEPDQYTVVSDHCRDRFCRPCAAFRGRAIAYNVKKYLRNRPYRFLTLTIKNNHQPLKVMVDKLFRCFAALRRTKLWNLKVTGGCAVIEVKPKDGGAGWHPHIHAIIEGKYLPLKPLRKLWLKITGDSFIVTIGYGRDPDHAAAYVSKYITKPFDDGTTRTPDRLIQAIEALHGRRLVTTFGAWRGQRLTEYHPSGVWVRVCPLGVLRERARKGDDQAVELLHYLARTQPYRNLPNPKARPPPGESESSCTSQPRSATGIDASHRSRRSTSDGSRSSQPDTCTPMPTPCRSESPASSTSPATTSSQSTSLPRMRSDYPQPCDSSWTPSTPCMSTDTQRRAATQPTETRPDRDRSHRTNRDVVGPAVARTGPGLPGPSATDHDVVGPGVARSGPGFRGPSAPATLPRARRILPRPRRIRLLEGEARPYRGGYVHCVRGAR